jgi:glycosyltransferase involved in cell wall biosynthesis
MLKVYIPVTARLGIGGGFSFTENIINALKDKVEFVDLIETCDLVFIPGPTLVHPTEIDDAKKFGKKIILRADNIPKNSRNRGCGTGRLYDLAQAADEIIYQSEWSKALMMRFIHKDGVVILNGADENIFSPVGPAIKKQGNPQYMFSCARRDDDKMWSKTWSEFQKYYFEDPDVHIWIAGKFSRDMIGYNFDLYGGAEKRYNYFGIIDDPKEMAALLRGADYFIYSYILDACSNSLIEARMCGTKILFLSDDDSGAKEIMAAPLEELTSKVMADKYLKRFELLCHP